MPIEWSDHAWDDYLYWQQTDETILERIDALLEDIACTPFEGIGRPEPLGHRLAGFWSRRIDDEHRLVYAVDNGRIQAAQCRYHY